MSVSGESKNVVVGGAGASSYRAILGGGIASGDSVAASAVTPAQYPALAPPDGAIRKSKLAAFEEPVPEHIKLAEGVRIAETLSRLEEGIKLAQRIKEREDAPAPQYGPDANFVADMTTLAVPGDEAPPAAVVHAPSAQGVQPDANFVADMTTLQDPENAAPAGGAAPQCRQM